MKLNYSRWAKAWATAALMFGVLNTYILCGQAGADVIGYWNFNSGISGTPWTSPIPADQGSGSISLDGWTGTTDAFTGTTLNALNSDPAGASLSLVNMSGNGSYIQIQFSMTGLADLGVSFATRGTGTGFSTGQWSYSTDGLSFTDFGTNTASTNSSFTLAGPLTTSGLDNAANAYLRYTLDGATSTGGNNRIDNLILETNAVPPPPPEDPRFPQPRDVVFGLDGSTGDTTLELVHGDAVMNGGIRNPGPWQDTPYIQSVAFDNYNGQLHNAHGNLLGVDFGATATGGDIYSFATQGTISDPHPGQPIGNTQPAPNNVGHDGSLTLTRLGSVAVNPSNNRVAVNGYDAGTVIVYDYTPGDTLGAGAALANGRQTPDAVSGNNILAAGSTQGIAWLDDSTVLTLNSATGDLLAVDSETMASSYKTTVSTDSVLGTPNVGSNFSALAYNPDVSQYLYALYSGFSSPNSVTHLYVLDPTSNFAQVADVDLSTSSQTGNEIALDPDGNLFISGFSSTITYIPASMILNPATLTNNSSIAWYSSTTASSFHVGMDIGFGTVTTLDGDFNGDGKVDAADYVVWRKGGSPNPNSPGDYNLWRAHFGESLSGSGSSVSGAAVVPEPSAVLLIAAVAVCISLLPHRSRSHFGFELGAKS